MATSVKEQSLNPYLTVKGAASAIALYQKAFGAKEIERMPAPDGVRLLHAELAINGGTVMLSDETPEEGKPAAPSPAKPSPAAITLHYAKPAEVDAVFQRAAEAGCRSAMEPHDAFWQARFAILADPFGYRWMLTAPLAEKT